MKAVLKTHRKLKLLERYVIEIEFYIVPKSSRYRDGIKYGLICKDLLSDDYILFDNHHPKGPHIHVGNREMEYEFVSEEKVIMDFKQYVLERMGIKL